MRFRFKAGKSVRKRNGFVGKGFKFDDMEAQMAVDRKKIQRAALGLQDSDDEDTGDVSAPLTMRMQLELLVTPSKRCCCR